MSRELTQFFDHDLLGPVPFKDGLFFCYFRRAHPKDFKLGVKMSASMNRETRAQIADDININRGANLTGIRKGYEY